MTTFYLELLSTLLAFTVIGLQSQQKTLAWPLNIIKKSLGLIVFYNKASLIYQVLDRQYSHLEELLWLEKVARQ